MSSLPPRADRLASLDGLRCAMAWSVALYHFGILARAFPAGSRASSITTVLGLHSVEAFFMLSGFCMFHLHGDMRLEPPALRRFFWHRFVRIAPLFYFVLTLNLLAQIDAGPQFTWSRLFTNLTFTFGAIHPNHAMVTGGWSIGLETLFYASFPWLAVLLRPLAAHAAAALLAIATACVHTIALETVDQAARFNAYVVLENHAFAFLLGGLLAKLRALIQTRIAVPVALAIACAAFAAFAASQPAVWDHFDVVLGDARAAYVAASFGLIALFAFTPPASERAERWMSELGELSYPVYLLHPLAWQLCRSWLPEGTAPALAIACAVVATLALARAAYRCYERPVRHYLAVRGPGRALRSV